MIAVFGSINLDLIFALTKIPAAGETLLSPGVRMEPGGKGANQAVAAARDGATVVMAGAVGRDGLALPALAGLRAANVDLARVIETDSATGCAAISVDPLGQNAIAVGSGANLLARATQIEDALLGQGTTLIVQMETDPAETAALIMRARSRGVRIVLNLAPAGALDLAALRAVDILVVNETESDWLSAALDTESVGEALGVDVIRTLGGDGAEWLGARQNIRFAALPITPADTTAAGDCFTGVLAAALDRGVAMEEAIRRAVVAAGLCCTRSGSQSSLPDAQSIDAALQHYGSARSR